MSCNDSIRLNLVRALPRQLQSQATRYQPSVYSLLQSAHNPSSHQQTRMARDLTLISFDVDGTLIRSVGDRANYLHKEAFSHALKITYGLDTNIDVIPHHGSTDPLIIVKVAQHHGVSKEEAMAKLPEACQVMIDYFLSHQSESGSLEGLAVLPGVVELMTRLKAMDNVVTCLVTGNLTPIGWAKMRSLGLIDLFTTPNFGGFGSDFCSGNFEESWKDRGRFVEIAAEKYAAMESAGSVTAKYHIGDTPMDIKAAVFGNAIAIGVATGIYTKEQLEAVPGEAMVLENFLNVDAVLAALGLL